MKPNKYLHRFFRRNETELHELNYLFWECTQRCNLRCLHCGSDCAFNAKAPDTPFEDFLRAILPLKSLYKADDMTVVITGGEPLLRQDLASCGKTLRKHGFRWGIVTNGFAYTLDTHAKLLAAGMGSITLSLDGLEGDHNWLRGNERSFENAVKALDLIVSTKGLIYDVVTCVNRRNVYGLSALKDFLVSRGVKAWRLFTIAPIGRAANDERMTLTDEELKGLMDFIAYSREKDRIDVKFSCEAFVGEYEQRVRDSYFFCRAGINIASVLIDGSISACPNINRGFVQGNIYRDDFLEVWNKRFEVMRRRAWTKVGLCADCKDYKDCKGGAMHLWSEKKDSILTCVNARLQAQRV
ncbi:MAG: TIGR04133 family radical SAM/SPASM protein [Treponema sp.]|jgi:radical SAM enzyme (rSAM/lipoprotein system)|nr:TIGR04133 family radical SAM/SPASM protein [Treponema sp.]